MNCYIYRCSRKEDLYIYLAERDDFSVVPAEIMRSLGVIEFAMELELAADTKLACEDASTVMKNLQEKGFHLQLPKDTSIESIMARIANGRN
ncbi:MAG: YcgL domain-containing protein [Gammaproteobacteria bacterium]|jgi:uncharacterized protein YcgL (UPF0745 family)